MPTKQEIKDRLDEAGIDFNSKETKDDLEAKLPENAGSASAQEDAPDSHKEALEQLASGTILEGQYLVPGKVQRFAQDALDG